MLAKLLYLTKGILGRTFYIIPEQPERIQIEITNRCNYTCGMCPRESFQLPESDISPDLFRLIIDRITQGADQMARPATMSPSPAGESRCSIHRSLT